MKDIDHAGVAAAASVGTLDAVIDHRAIGIHECVVTLEHPLIRQVQIRDVIQTRCLVVGDGVEQQIDLALKAFELIRVQHLGDQDDALATKGPGCLEKQAPASADAIERKTDRFGFTLAVLAAQQARQCRLRGLVRES